MLVRYSRLPSLLVMLATISPMPTLGQNSDKLIYLSESSTLDVKDMTKQLQKECPNTSFTTDKTKSDYTLEARMKTAESNPQDGLPESSPKSSVESHSSGLLVFVVVG